MTGIKENSVIQVNEHGPEEWIGCLLIVDEVKSWGVLARLKIPVKGTAYMRLQNEHIEVIGQAVMIPQIEE